jgi:hypothetical protein
MQILDTGGHGYTVGHGRVKPPFLKLNRCGGLTDVYGGLFNDVEVH